jgi:hypothetical protein
MVTMAALLAEQPSAAERTGLHLSTVRAHRDRLVEAGLLVKARANDGAPADPPGGVGPPHLGPPRPLAAALLDHLATAGGGTPAAVAAGQAWGRRLAVLEPFAGSGADRGPSTRCW